MTEEVYTIANKAFTFDEFEAVLNEAKSKGADHFKVEISREPLWNFDWVRFYRTVPQDEIKQRQIKSLEQQLSELKSNNE